MARSWTARCSSGRGLINVIPEYFDSEIHRDQAQNAVYLSVEGGAEEPAVVGVLVDGDFEPFVCDPVLKPAAAEKGLPFLEIAKLAEMLAARCRSDDRLLIGWSDSVLTAFATHSGNDLSVVFREARAIAADWMARCHPGQAPSRDWRRLGISFFGS